MDISLHSKIKNKIFDNIILALTLFSVLMLIFIFYFLFKESLPLFEKISVFDFLFKNDWMPISFGDYEPTFGIFNFLCATIYTSILSMIFALFLSINASIILLFVFNDNLSDFLLKFIDILSGVPSIIFGFLGLEVFSPLFISLGIKNNGSVLLASIVLSFMLLPFLISSITFSFTNYKRKYQNACYNLGFDKWYMILVVILPSSVKSILISTITALCRALGETMAVMMVIGNANLFPTLLGKSETISGLIALEMGTAVKGSLHYNALFSAGLTLSIITLFLTNIIHFAGRERNL